MLEIAEYRASERHARSVMASWLTGETHQVDHFARSGFPVRIESLHEVGQLLDTMQEGRFALFQNEMRGLTTDDHDRLCDALATAVRFQMAHLPKRRPIVPISTMISSLALFRKITGFKPDVGSVLEVGPGCGYLSYFLAGLPSLRDYSQVEACESFYLLQSLLNGFLFRDGFCELAIAGAVDLTLNLRRDVEAPVMLADAELPGQRCFHFPWWTLGALHDGSRRYDVVTSNANLNEFTRNALNDYLSIFKRVLKPDGLFIVQCTGFPAHGSTEDLFGVLHEAGFAPLFCGLAHDVAPQYAGGPGPTETYRQLGFEDKSFALNNLLMVTRDHPLYEQAHRREHFRHGHAVPFAPLASIYHDRGERRRYVKDELVAAVKARLRPAS